MTANAFPPRFLAVRNFTKFQHYRNRRPPWIKLHQTTLEDYAFARLPDASKAHAMLLWLLASRYDNRIPNDAEWLTRELHASEPVDVAALFAAGFLTDAGEALASHAQAVPVEEEREEEEEREAETPPPPAREPALEVEAERSRVSFWMQELPADLDDARAREAAAVFMARTPANVDAAFWMAELAGWLEGLNMPGMKPATQADIAAALSEYNRERGRDYSPRHVRTFVYRAVRERLELAKPIGPRQKFATKEDAAESALADRKRKSIAVLQRRDDNLTRELQDGAEWYARIVREAASAGVSWVEYGFERLHQPATVGNG